MDRSRQLVDAAVVILADQGARALTHRAVDAAAGLPAGSASNVYRTRRALVVAVVTRLLVNDVDRLTAPLVAFPGPAEAGVTPGALLAGWAEATSRTARTETLARLALLVDEDADALREGRAALVEIGREHVGPAFGLVLDPRVVATAIAVVDGVLIDSALTGRPVEVRLLATALDALLQAGPSCTGRQ